MVTSRFVIPLLCLVAVMRHSYFRVFLAIACFCAMPAVAQVSVGNPQNPASSLKEQQFQRPENCLPCHQRQYNELRTAVKAGYRSVSPLFNGLEVSGNLLSGGLLRPVYSDSTNKTKTDGTPLTTNLTTTPSFSDLNQVRAGFCLTCHTFEDTCSQCHRR